MWTKCYEKWYVLQKDIWNLKLKLLSANSVVQILQNEKRRITETKERKLKRHLQLKNTRATEVHKMYARLQSLEKEKQGLGN